MTMIQQCHVTVWDSQVKQLETTPHELHELQAIRAEFLHLGEVHLEIESPSRSHSEEHLMKAEVYMLYPPV